MPITLHETWENRVAWDQFVDAHGQGRFCHLYDYGEVVTCYGYRPIRLAFARQDDLVAVLPGALVNSLIFGRKIVSQPFSEYGGFLVDPSLSSVDMAAIRTLLDGYLKASPKIRIVELHGDHGIPSHMRQSHCVQINPHHVAVLRLEQPIERLWEDVVQYSVRKSVNKALTNGVEAFEECNETVIRTRFFPLYLMSMKRLGVPPHSIAYYLRCHEYLRDRMKIFWAVRNGKFLAGLLGFVTGGRVNIVNIVSDPDGWKFAPNDLVHWEFIKWAAIAGLKFFDFGSVRYEGQRTYKRKWGTDFEEHAYFILSAHPTTGMSGTFDSSSSQMTRLARIWTAHVPDSIARAVGPYIRKQLVR